MNKYVKNVGFALFAMGISYGLSAQIRYTDLEVTGVSPSGEVKNGGRLPLVFKMTNHGPDDEIQGDTTFYRLYQVQDGVVKEVYSGMLAGAASLVGESSYYRDNYSITINLGDLKETTTIDFCFELFTRATLPNGDILVLSRQDTNYSNNVNCTKVTVVPRTTGIEDQGGLGNFFSIYPNPADKIVALRMDDDAFTGDLKVSISDISGNTLLAYQFKESEAKRGVLSLNVGQLPIGVYIVRIQTETATVAQRLTISR